MKKLLLILNIFVCLTFCSNSAFAEDNEVAIQTPVDREAIIALYNANKLQEAYQLIATIPESDRDAEMWFLLANITQDYDKEMDSVFLLQKAIEVEPTFYKAYYNLGLIYLKDNKTVSAIQNFQQAVKYKKDFAYGYYNLGCAYLKDSEFKSAKSNFIKAIQLKNDEPDFFYNLALTYKKMNKNKQASKTLAIYNSMIKG
ncbi:MAG: tetratricopeptide repeat protein [Candidatus Gastranaerophilales bacterium]|nr:tetratricopeptide repeat protein [Candidatus Gastranaerophilales bacterium]